MNIVKNMNIFSYYKYSFTTIKFIYNHCNIIVIWPCTCTIDCCALFYTQYATLPCCTLIALHSVFYYMDDKKNYYLHTPPSSTTLSLLHHYVQPHSTSALHLLISVYYCIFFHLLIVSFSHWLSLPLFTPNEGSRSTV